MGEMDMSVEEKSRFMHLQEISQQEFCDHIEDDDLFLAYGNPLIVNCENGTRLVAIAWPLAERVLRRTGGEGEAGEVIDKSAETPVPEDKDDHEELDDDPRIKYWIYEFEMPDTVKAEIEARRKQYELTRNEFFEALVRSYGDLERKDPEEFNKMRNEMRALNEEECEIRLARIYPVYKGETEAQALKRKLAEEKAAENNPR